MFYSAIRRRGNFTMIGPRKYVIDALQEREDKYPGGFNVGRFKMWAGEIARPDVERVMRVKRREFKEWYCTHSMINLAHPGGLSPTLGRPPNGDNPPDTLVAALQKSLHRERFHPLPPIDPPLPPKRSQSSSGAVNLPR